MIQWSLNHTGLKVRAHLATIAPRGSRNRKPMTHIIACATMYFSNGKSGGRWNVVAGWLTGSPDPAVFEPVDEPPPVEIKEIGLVGSFEVAEITFVRSSVSGPELRC